MELKDLIGSHELTGVDRYNADVKAWYGDSFESCEHLSFRLDGKTYTVIEDPDDGYRSSMREITESNIDVKNTFAPVAVIGRHVTTTRYSGDADILELISATNGKTILRVGTDDVGDYYPSFVAEFDPTAIGEMQ